MAGIAGLMKNHSAAPGGMNSPRGSKAVVRLAGGGPVEGPGDGTSDSIPALLSKGEFVMPADSTRAIGVAALTAMRDATHQPTGQGARKGAIARLADGGVVDELDKRRANDATMPPAAGAAPVVAGADSPVGKLIYDGPMPAALTPTASVPSAMADMGAGAKPVIAAAAQSPGPIAQLASRGAQPLMQDVVPSGAGAGRGIVNPPAAGPGAGTAGRPPATDVLSAPPNTITFDPATKTYSGGPNIGANAVIANGRGGTGPISARNMAAGDALSAKSAIDSMAAQAQPSPVAPGGAGPVIARVGRLGEKSPQDQMIAGLQDTMQNGTWSVDRNNAARQLAELTSQAGQNQRADANNAVTLATAGATNELGRGHLAIQGQEAALRIKSEDRRAAEAARAATDSRIRLGLDAQRVAREDANSQLDRESKMRMAGLENAVLNGTAEQRQAAAQQIAAFHGRELPGTGKSLTESQAKALLFGSRMQASNDVMDTLEKGGKVFSTPGANGPLGSVINMANSAEGQKLDQAKRDFINAVLRRESGAVISESEFDNGSKQYFPQPGDSPDVIKQKRDNRMLAQRGILAEVPNSDSQVAKVRGPSPPAAVDAVTAAPRQPVASQDAYVKLPSGATYVAPDGSTRRKP